MLRLAALNAPDRNAAVQASTTCVMSSAPGGAAPVEEALKILIAHDNASVKAITDNDGWEEIEFAVDSGASETVVGPDMLASIETKEGAQRRRGVTYEIASGERIENLGEKRFIASSENEVMRKLTAQVVDVNQPLLAVRGMVGTGHRVVFDSEGSYIEDKINGEYIPLHDDGKMYTLRLWACKESHEESFQRQGR